MSDLVIQRERDRLRREAREGVCPTCGRIEVAHMERRLREYAAENARLHAKLALAPAEKSRPEISS
jgi:hypothetical protein